MKELDATEQRILADCLRALDQGEGVDDSLARYPEHAEALRPYLELRARLLAIEQPVAPASALAAGRQALLDRLAGAAPAKRRPLLLEKLSGMIEPWFGLSSPLARTAAAAVLLVLLAGGALGASAAAGVDPARDALSALPFIEPSGESEEAASPNAEEGPGNADEGTGNAPAAATPGQGQADDNASEGGGNGLDNATDNANCVPQGVLDRLPFLAQLLADHPVCPTDGTGETEEGQPTDVPRGPPITPPGQSNGPTPNGPPITPPGQSHRQTPQGPPTDAPPATPPGQSHRQTPQGPPITPPGQQP